MNFKMVVPMISRAGQKWKRARYLGIVELWGKYAGWGKAIRNKK